VFEVLLEVAEVMSIEPTRFQGRAVSWEAAVAVVVVDHPLPLGAESVEEGEVGEDVKASILL
jgi:hypothetical protein